MSQQTEAKVANNESQYKLSDEQIDIVLRNWWRILGITEITCVFCGKPVFSEFNTTRYRLYKFTRFAAKYTVFRGIGNKFGPLFFCVYDTNHFDKIEICVHSFFNQLVEEWIVPGNYTRPQIFICPITEISQANYKKIPENIMKYPYRIVSLWDLYAVLGSVSGNIGYTFDYKLYDNLPIEYNKKDYANICDYDVICKILNAIPNDVIEYKRIMNECSPYIELVRRRVVETNNTTEQVSGVFFGGIDEGFYRDYEVDQFYRPVIHKPYIGPTDVKNMGKWGEYKPIMTKKEYYELIERLDPEKYKSILAMDKLEAEGFEPLRKALKNKNKMEIVEVEVEDEPEVEVEDEPEPEAEQESDDNQEDSDSEDDYNVLDENALDEGEAEEME